MIDLTVLYAAIAAAEADLADDDREGTMTPKDRRETEAYVRELRSDLEVF